MEKIIQELVNTLTDDQFLEFYEKVKQQAELIKKQKRLNEIDQKFRAQGIKCPKCKSYHCALKMDIIQKENRSRLVFLGIF
ncbi:hypothetical protein [Spiroplasma endosymbiont of Clivina fossor]|uniref:hypothetical protein n=1 Tax=Spiroplasma endosymbiont of Clivina fossor TaxID=3066282 RepID=UPI00313C4B9B